MNAMTAQPLCTVDDWRAAYRSGALPAELLGALLARLDPQDPAWIQRGTAELLAPQLARLAALDPAHAPLWGVPFAAKDNIDAAGWTTTAASPAFAHVAEADAGVVRRLMDAGAVLVGKTNLDQFATGLVGTRSPYGAVPNSFDPRYVSGGSSSGSASVVARGLVPIALGTDTAGSGRVPAGFNNLVGVKPTPGRLDMSGVLPACKTLDVVSVFALTVADAALAAACIDDAPDTLRPTWFSSPLRLGVPAEVVLDAAIGQPAAWDAACERARLLGAELVPVDMSDFDAVAALLYAGPWVAERYAVLRSWVDERPDTMDPTVLAVVSQARRFDAAAAFEGQYRLQDLARRIAPTWQRIDALMVPTAPSHPMIEEVAAEPIARNSELGRYTNFVNLLGLAALAVPAGFMRQGLPFGVTFIAPGGSDAALAHHGMDWERSGMPLTLGARLREARPKDLQASRVCAAAPSLLLAVVGAHLRGMPLHGQLQERGCRFVEATRSAAHYRLHALPGTVPPKPGLARVRKGEAGHEIELELYEMPQSAVGSFLALIPPPLGLGSVELADGRWVNGFICEGAALAAAPDISAFGGWRAFMAAKIAPTPAGTPNAVDELTPIFHAYERALMANDVEALNSYFWDDARVTRYGIADRQFGADELRAFRAGTPAPQFTRVLENLRLNAFGPDMAVAQVEFVRSDTALRGFQTQTWVRFEEGWRIVAAHVSMIPWPIIQAP
ncbi:MAG TPA: allophanate hydrolase [Burkholderiaceae bacterium]|jgi:allophanate hydrolase